MQLEEVAKLKEKRIVDEQQKQEIINQNFKEKIEKIEQEKLVQLEEVTKLKEKRLVDEQQEKERLDQLYKEQKVKEQQRRIEEKELKKSRDEK